MSTIQVQDLIKDKRVVIHAAPTMTCQEALATMNLFNITGLPLFSPETGYFGFISVFDIMTYVALFSHFKDELGASSQLKPFANLERPISDLVAISEESKSGLWKTYGQDETLSSLADKMSSGIHRLLVAYNDEARLLTQTDVVKYLYKHNVDENLTKKTLSELGMGQSTNVVTIKSSVTALAGFREIYNHKVTGIAVVDDHGKMVHTLSSSDVRVLTEENLKDLFLPVSDYLKKYSERSSEIFVGPQATLREAMAKLIEGRVHRVWVCEGNVPLGVVTMSDIIRLWYK
eukprot:TRINITY_DN12349_c0_g1_i1.p1 TRINITY_DN12349_c0_g1~~TRINITY_DN12349_c0_g1_i1.p1  ORF type:complete len:289 (-),score=57.76 TRINITY_DN12349_c0_g1_i1:97-963(-)